MTCTVPDRASLARHGVTLSEVPGVGHFLMLENPAAASRALGAAIAASPARRECPAGPNRWSRVGWSRDVLRLADAGVDHRGLGHLGPARVSACRWPGTSPRCWA